MIRQLEISRVSVLCSIGLNGSYARWLHLLYIHTCTCGTRYNTSPYIIHNSPVCTHKRTVANNVARVAPLVSVFSVVKYAARVTILIAALVYIHDHPSAKGFGARADSAVSCLFNRSHTICTCECVCVSVYVCVHGSFVSQTLIHYSAYLFESNAINSWRRIRIRYRSRVCRVFRQIVRSNRDSTKPFCERRRQRERRLQSLVYLSLLTCVCVYMCVRVSVCIHNLAYTYICMHTVSTRR